jgi:hypothetical protein
MTRLALANTFHDLPRDTVRQMVGLNLTDAYPRIDTEALAATAKRVGIAPTEIATAPDLSMYRVGGTAAFRTQGPWS